MADSLIPISDEQAKLGQEALKTLQGLAGFLKETFGTLPQDIVGMLGGDYLKVRRAENLFRTMEKTKKRLEDGHVKQPDAPPLLALPIMIAAADETRDELQNVWAALSAAAADPESNRFFRLQFIEVAKQLDPMDTIVLHKLNSLTGQVKRAGAYNTLTTPPATSDQTAVSINNLLRLGLFIEPNTETTMLSPFGREFLKAVA